MKDSFILSPILYLKFENHEKKNLFLLLINYYKKAKLPSPPQKKDRSLQWTEYRVLVTEVKSSQGEIYFTHLHTCTSLVSLTAKSLKLGMKGQL